MINRRFLSIDSRARLCAGIVFGLMLAAFGTAGPAQVTALPAELHSKKLIDTAIYTLDSSPIPVNSKTLSQHPSFTLNHPFDGIAVRALLDEKWRVDVGARLSTATEKLVLDPYLDGMIWSKERVPHEAAAEAVADLNRVRWGSLTDNFLWCNFRGAEEILRADITIDEDWAAVEHNAKVVGRVCRQAKLKGILFDTEQYSHFKGSKDPYPMGRGSAELRRDRGARWMKALRSECPDIKIIIFFAWSPDLGSAEFLKGVKDFLDGMLDGIEAPSRLIHGYENTFYYGQPPGSRFTKEGFRGDRARYREAVASMRSWRSLSADPAKYDRFVDVGMAAWLESDPWNLWAGWPSGSKDTIWSNVPMALATSDEYVWCWSEHSNFLHGRTGPEANRPAEEWLNPFLASLTNQTFNRGTERTTHFDETFENDPLLKGWYFDFDMLTVGRVKSQGSAPILAREAVPYFWSREKSALVVTGEGSPQRRQRYVHPIAPLSRLRAFELAVDFQVDAFPEDASNPILLGLFNENSPTEREALAIRIRPGGGIAPIFPGSAPAAEPSRVEVGRDYQARFDFDSKTRRARITVSEAKTAKVIARWEASLEAEFRLDEAGAAWSDADGPVKPLGKAHVYQVKRFSFKSR